MQTDEVIIQTNQLTYRYGKLTAIEEVDLRVCRGEIFGFLGPNGAGKTTTIRVLLDFLRPSSGSASIFGLDSRADGKSIRGRLGYLPSELTLWDNWTGVQYIRWLERMHRGSLMDEAQRLAERLDYDLKRSLRGLSTGMKRKMGIIAALSHKPELLVLDEPTTGLDPLMQNVFHELMREAREEGRTVFLSSHNLPEVEAICDRVAIIRDGHIEATETVARLTHVAFRWLTLTMREPISPNGFSAISGVTDVTTNGSVVKMRISGEADLDAVIKQAAQHTVADMSFEQPTLEEIFLTYYGEKEA